MDFKDELLKPLLISDGNFDVLPKLSVDWIQTYKKFAHTLCFQYPIAISFCSALFCLGETEFNTIPFLHAKAKYLAIGYLVLLLFITLIEIFMVKKQTQIYFEHWQKELDFENIGLENPDPDCHGSKTGIQYCCPSPEYVTSALFLITLVPYLVAGIIIGSPEMFLIFILSGLLVAALTCGYMYPVSLAFDGDTCYKQV